MLFNSLTFLCFFSIVWVLCFLFPSKFRWLWLLLASSYFYFIFYPLYLLIPVAIIVVDYCCALAMEHAGNAEKRNWFFYLALFTNLAVLIFFKYFVFLHFQFSQLFSSAHTANSMLKIILPLGISFFTFQSMSYLIDVKNGDIRAERSIGIFALFILFFPQISAGPIARSQNLLPQLRSPSRVVPADLFIGFSQVLLGFFKKVVVGDMLGNYVNTFDGVESHWGFAHLFTCWIFLFQLYADFSGYSDIAIGTARMLGYKLQMNFALPLFSKTMTEVWRRWHISLSTWLRDYLYTPIFIAKRDWGKTAVAVSLLITFIICGIWHGAGWQFVVYGLILGIYLVAEVLLKIKSSYFNKNFFRKLLGVFITFNLFSFSLIFFRKPNLAACINVIKTFFLNFLPLKVKVYDGTFFLTMMVMLGILLFIDYMVFRKNDFESLYAKKRKTLIFLNVALFFLILLFGISSNTQFIYFQF